MKSCVAAALKPLKVILFSRVARMHVQEASAYLQPLLPACADDVSFRLGTVACGVLR